MSRNCFLTLTLSLTLTLTLTLTQILTLTQTFPWGKLRNHRFDFHIPEGESRDCRRDKTCPLSPGSEGWFWEESAFHILHLSAASLAELKQKDTLAVTGQMIYDTKREFSKDSP